MLNLPAEVTAVLALFAPVFTPTVWAAERFTPFTAGRLADSTGFALPPALKALFSGIGGFMLHV